MAPYGSYTPLSPTSPHWKPPYNCQKGLSREKHSVFQGNSGRDDFDDPWCRCPLFAPSVGPRGDLGPRRSPSAVPQPDTRLERRGAGAARACLGHDRDGDRPHLVGFLGRAARGVEVFEHQIANPLDDRLGAPARVASERATGEQPRDRLATITSRAVAIEVDVQHEARALDDGKRHRG